MNAAASATPRMTAEDRRESVIAAASTEFASGGYAGTSTAAIARRVGVSQPYLFQLFGTKKGLFLAVVRACFRWTRASFEESARQARKASSDPIHILHAMGMTYIEMLRDREMLRLQLQSYAACDDPDIQAVVRDEWASLYRSVAGVSGAREADLHAFFAEGMLLNVAASIGDIDQAIALKLAYLGGVDAEPE